jgi:hypothetical protein
LNSSGLHQRAVGAAALTSAFEQIVEFSRKRVACDQRHPGLGSRVTPGWVGRPVLWDEHGVNSLAGSRGEERPVAQYLSEPELDPEHSRR